MEVIMEFVFDETLRKALAHRWGKKKLPTKREIESWLGGMIDRSFQDILEAAYKDEVIGKYW